MRCIICLEEKSSADFSLEHVFPDSIGGTFTIGTVCTDCNSRLGSEVDAILVDHGLIKLKRFQLGIKNKSGKVPNPFGDGLSTRDQTKKVRWEFDRTGKSKGLYVLPSIPSIGAGPGQYNVVVDAGEREQIPTIVNKMRTRAGLPPETDDQILGAATLQSEANPEVQFDIVIDLHQYKRPILKIAYELATYWLGPAYLDDPTGKAILAAVFDSDMDEGWPKRHDIQGTFGAFGDDCGLVLPEPQSSMHFGSLHIWDDMVGCQVRVFDAFCGAIRISSHPKHYPTIEPRLLTVDAVNRRHREGPWEDELQRVLVNPDLGHS